MQPEGGQSAVDGARARQVEVVLERVESIPTLSPVAARLLKLGSVTGVPIGDVVRLIESDPALSTRILGLCRKADRGLGDRIKTVRRAVLMLGVDAVRSAALSVSVYDLMSRGDDGSRAALDESVAGAAGGGRGTGGDAAEPPAFDRKGFWRHSIAVACAAELIAAGHPKLRVQPEEAFLAGLLHDVGKLVLDLVLPRSYDRVVRLAERRGSDSAPVERAVIGIDHHTAGRRVAEHWGLPASVQGVVWLHGTGVGALPEGADATLIAVVTAAKAVCRGLHLGWSGDFGPAADAGALWRDLKLKRGGPGSIAGPLHAAVADRLSVLGLDDVTPPDLLLESLANANRALSGLNSSLRERARQAESQAAALAAIGDFHAGLTGARGVSETAALVLASAAAALGAGRYALLYRSVEEGPWRLFGPGEGAAAVLRGEGDDASAEMAELLAAMPAHALALPLAAWLRTPAGLLVDPRRTRVLALRRGCAAEDGAEIVGAALLHDRDVRELPLGSTQIAPLVATWGAALAGAGEREASRRLGERLLESGRALAETRSALAGREAMARLGETTAGAAHEMNGPLTVITGRAQLLAMRVRDEKDKAALEAIAEAGRSVSEIITTLHTLATTPVAKSEAVDVAGVMSAACGAAAGRVPGCAPAGVAVGPGCGRARTDGGMLRTIVEELVANALQACPAGPVSVRVACDPLEGGLQVRVEDAGPGMSPRALAHAFDPFFSERAAGRGRGLGLTRARRLADALGADLALGGDAGAAAREGKGRGTVAVLTLRSWREDGETDAGGSERGG